MKLFRIVALGAVALALVVFAVSKKTETAKMPAIQTVSAITKPATTVVEPANMAENPQVEPPPTAPAVPKAALVAEAKTDKMVPVSKSAKINPGNGQPKIPKIKPPIQDPDARLALSLVGADPEAERYWAAAINDPNIPAEERKDLIEDLNEDGLSDPKHPGPQDMPLILNRINIIQELAKNPMDKVNEDAMAEALKDLVNLANGRKVD